VPPGSCLVLGFQKSSPLVEALAFGNRSALSATYRIPHGVLAIFGKQQVTLPSLPPPNNLSISFAKFPRSISQASSVGKLGAEKIVSKSFSIVREMYSEPPECGFLCSAPCHD
jgi:hypothetical protein